jgi:hypothetical protein
MKKSVLFMTLLLLAGGIGYARDSKQSAAAEGAFLKAFEAAVINRGQIAQRLSARNQEEIANQLKIKHPNSTQIINLGKLPAAFYGQKEINTSATTHYLWEVKEGELVSFYYDVQVSPVSRATSDVIPSHISGLIISVREIKEAELMDKLRASVK